MVSSLVSPLSAWLLLLDGDTMRSEKWLKSVLAKHLFLTFVFFNVSFSCFSEGPEIPDAILKLQPSRGS